MRTLSRPLACAAALALTVYLPVPAAMAADPATPRPAAEVAAYADWSGGYIGLEGSAGGSYGAYNFGPATVGGRPVPAFKSGDATGRSDQGRNATTAVGGAFGGWNWQTGPVGLRGRGEPRRGEPEAAGPLDHSGFRLRGGGPGLQHRARQDRACTATLRARIGYSFDRYLIYGTFGLAGANARVLATYPDLDAGGQNTARRDLGYLGFTLGAGVQYAITDTLALGIDYRYVDLGGSRRFPLGVVPGMPAARSRPGRASPPTSSSPG